MTNTILNIYVKPQFNLVNLIARELMFENLRNEVKTFLRNYADLGDTAIKQSFMKNVIILQDDFDNFKQQIADDLINGQQQMKQNCLKNIEHIIVSEFPSRQTYFDCGHYIKNPIEYSHNFLYKIQREIHENQIAFTQFQNLMNAKVAQKQASCQENLNFTSAKYDLIQEKFNDLFQQLCISIDYHIYEQQNDNFLSYIDIQNSAFKYLVVTDFTITGFINSLDEVADCN